MKTSLISVDRLTISDRQGMYLLLQNNFQGITWESFNLDLARKNWVLLLKDQTSDNLKGFSTLLLSQKSFNRELINVIYSGDTIVDPTAWSTITLPRSWITAVNFLRQSYSDYKLYWLLICSGFRTYRFLPTFWRNFYPCYHVPTPDIIKELMIYLAQEYYGNYYDQNLGIVRFTQPQILRSGLIEIPAGRKNNPHIQFFEQKNPHYYLGDELVCFTEISYDNLTDAGKRMWESEFPLEIIN
jgi:hypothetical protein